MPRSFRLFSLFAAIAGLVAAGTALVVLSDYLATLTYHQGVATNMARIVDVNLQRLAQGADVALGRTADLVRAAGGSDHVDGEAARRRIRAYLDPVMGGDSLWVVDRHGAVTLESSSIPAASAINVGDRAYFAAARQDTALFIGPAIRSRFTNRVVITLTRGLRDRDGAFDGLVGITVEADWLASYYALLEPEMRPDIGIFHGDGGIVVTNRDLGAMLGLPAYDHPRWRRILEMRPPVGLLGCLDPDARLVARLDIPAYDLMVVVHLDTDEALSRWVVRSMNTSMVAALGALSLFAVMLFGIRSFERERAAVAAAHQATSDLAKARHDALTGLAGRGLFLDLSFALSAQAARHGEALGALYIDLDGFKQVNDRLGHDRGDEVLVETAQAIGKAIRGADVAGRIGGDEFVVCIAGPAEVIAQAMADVAERIRLGIAEIGDGIACSIGLAHEPALDADLPALLRRADGAMREAKARGKNQVAAT